MPEGLRKFLKFVAADIKSSTEDFDDEYVRSLQKSVSRIKSDREMGERYMLLKELLSDERAEGRNEGITIGRNEGITIGRNEGITIGKNEGIAIGRAEDVIELLLELGEVPAELFDAIKAEKDLDRLSAYHKAAAKAESVDIFRKETGL